MLEAKRRTLFGPIDRNIDAAAERLTSKIQPDGDLRL